MQIERTVHVNKVIGDITLIQETTMENFEDALDDMVEGEAKIHTYFQERMQELVRMAHAPDTVAVARSHGKNNTLSAQEEREISNFAEKLKRSQQTICHAGMDDSTPGKP